MQWQAIHVSTIQQPRVENEDLSGNSISKSLAWAVQEVVSKHYTIGVDHAAEVFKMYLTFDMSSGSGGISSSTMRYSADMEIKSE
jgi:hypothetical protein